MSDIFFFTADEGRAEHRLDMVVASYFSDVTRSRAQQLIAEGFVKVNGAAKNKNYKVKFGDKLSIHTPKPKPVETAPENIPLDIRYEDEDLLVVNKPKGMVVHPAAGHENGTLVNALLYHCGKSLSAKSISANWKLPPLAVSPQKPQVPDYRRPPPNQHRDCTTSDTEGGHPLEGIYKQPPEHHPSD